MRNRDCKRRGEEEIVRGMMKEKKKKLKMGGHHGTRRMRILTCEDWGHFCAQSKKSCVHFIMLQVYSLFTVLFVQQIISNEKGAQSTWHESTLLFSFFE